MSTRIVIDPVTRIEGHLRIDVEVDGGKVSKAWSSGQMWRGIEIVLQGRDPRTAWQFTQRLCGVCTTVHAVAAVRAVENALRLEVPLNAQYLRNLILAAHALHDHIVHFYHLSALDWVDVVSALGADPAGAARLAQGRSAWPRDGRLELAAVRDRLRGFVEDGRLGLFAGGYPGHPAMKLSPELNLLVVAHYLQALDYQRKADRIVAVLGSKTPNIRNLAVGGMADAIDLDGGTTIDRNTLRQVKGLLDDLTGFVEQVYLPDVCAISGPYADWLDHGAGVTNYLAVPDLPLDRGGTSFDLPGGTMLDGDPATARAIGSFDDPYFRGGVSENISHAWYDGHWTRHPYDGETVPGYSDFEDEGKYSWIKAPRFEGRPMQVGPLAQVLVGRALGHEPTRRWLDRALDAVSSVAGTRLGPQALHSTLGRHLCRAVRAAVICELAGKHWRLLIDNVASGDTEVRVEPRLGSAEYRGFGFHEAPRGALSHWIVIRDGTIANYQVVVPSTWNAGPRDEQGRPGPYEAALVGHPVSDPERPLEVLRTVHSFDPCIACAVHTLDVEGREIARVRAL